VGLGWAGGGGWGKEVEYGNVKNSSGLSNSS
jgi:hypothetical protein